MEQKDESYYIKRILEGETEHFSVFLDRYSRPLYALIVQIVGCHEDAEELLQDVFLKAFRHLNRYKGECRFLRGFIALLTMPLSCLLYTSRVQWLPVKAG